MGVEGAAQAGQCALQFEGECGIQAVGGRVRCEHRLHLLGHAQALGIPQQGALQKAFQARQVVGIGQGVLDGFAAVHLKVTQAEHPIGQHSQRVTAL